MKDKLLLARKAQIYTTDTQIVSETPKLSLKEYIPPPPQETHQLSLEFY